MRRDELRQLIRRSESRRPRADDHHVDVESLALDAGKFRHSLLLAKKSPRLYSALSPQSSSLVMYPRFAVLEQLIALLLLLIASGVTSFVSTAIVKKAAESIGLVDRPDARKLHPEATPRVGGLAIIFGFGFPLLLLAANSHAAGLVAKNITYLFAVLASGSLVVGPGGLVE